MKRSSVHLRSAMLLQQKALYNQLPFRLLPISSLLSTSRQLIIQRALLAVDLGGVRHLAARDVPDRHRMTPMQVVT